MSFNLDTYFKDLIKIAVKEALDEVLLKEVTVEQVTVEKPVEHDVSFLNEEVKFEPLPPETLKQVINEARLKGVDIKDIKGVIKRYGYERTNEIKPEDVAKVANDIVILVDSKDAKWTC